jgi:hypothetical protein
MSDLRLTPRFKGQAGFLTSLKYYSAKSVLSGNVTLEHCIFIAHACFVYVEAACVTLQGPNETV